MSWGLWHYVILILVAKRKSLFDDKATEIDELTYIVKQVEMFMVLRAQLILNSLTLHKLT